jgi:dihydroneopterin aldolase
MGKILLEGMEFFAYHGHYEEEQIIGTKFIVDIEIDFERLESRTF